ncbi:MAG: hypothetical protein LBG27_05970, partial [Spirochaetaceae bacterium]|nr:hypothetical protein [Spirochaetaceae bacterium]
ILNELAGTTGLNRDHLVHVLASYGKKRSVQAGGERVVLEARALREAGAGEAGREAAEVSGRGVHTPPDARLGGSWAALRQTACGHGTGHD